MSKIGKNIKKSLPNQLSDDDLLQIALNGEDIIQDDPIKSGTDVIDFLMTFGIKSGEQPVRKELLYSVYNDWSKDKVSKNDFSNEVSFFIKTTRQYIYISTNAFKLSEKAFLEYEKKHKKKDYSVKKSHIEHFFKWFSFEKGKTWISGIDFYKIYDYWHYKNKPKNRIGQRGFYELCTLYFETKRNKDGIHFGLNRSILAPVMEYNEEKRKKKDKKKHDEISST